MSAIANRSRRQWLWLRFLGWGYVKFMLCGLVIAEIDFARFAKTR